VTIRSGASKSPEVPGTDFVVDDGANEGRILRHGSAAENLNFSLTFAEENQNILGCKLCSNIWLISDAWGDLLLPF